MRLINTRSLELKEYLGDPTNPRFPRYAILSHTWGEDEVTFRDIQDLDTAKKKASFSKIAKCCETALSEGLGWAWVDTCCIDKSNNAELTEVINSMFKWYEASTICYAYLSDVGDVGAAKHRDWRNSRWFTRGWTLQELVAPFEVVIYDCVWKQLGTKRRLTKELGGKTGIPEEVLLYPVARRKHSVAARMAWATGRQTTRVEDRAYCLLGLFDIVNMSLVYGEGEKSFSRLHQEIMNTQQDDTIFMGGLIAEDQDLAARKHRYSTTYGRGFLATPDNVPVELPAAIQPLPDAPGISHNPAQLIRQLYDPGVMPAQWERRDPRLRGDIISMSMRIIQVNFSRYGSAGVPLTRRKQTHIELDLENKEALEMSDLYGDKAMAGSLCLAMLRCSAPDGRLVARYFSCFLAGDEIWAYPTGVYRFVTPDEARHWPHMQCHILVGVGSWKSYPQLEGLRDAAAWESEAQQGGAFDNGWRWEANTAEDKEILVHQPNIGLVKSNTHYYRLSFSLTGQVWELTISVTASQTVSQLLGIIDVNVAIVLYCPAALELGVQSEKLKHVNREGLVTELWHRLPVSGGSAELVVSLYCGVDEGKHCYSPMIRFRAFQPSDGEVTPHRV